LLIPLKNISEGTCSCYHAVLSDCHEETQFMEICGYGLGLSGLVDKYDSRHKERIARDVPDSTRKKIVTVQTTTLDGILKKEGVIRVDFLSIDTEGSELAILSTIDFSYYDIDVITIEDNYKDPALMDFFVKRGYQHVHSIGCDKIFRKVKNIP